MLRTLVASMLLAAAPAAFAQDAYRTRPVTMIVPFPPGGVADLVGRPTGAPFTGRAFFSSSPVRVAAAAGAGGGTAAAR